MGELHLISTGKQEKEIFIKKASDVHTYCDAIHLREKTWQAADFIEVIRALLEAGVPKEKIIVNSHAEIAHVAGAGGIHLTSASEPTADVKAHYPHLRIGRSTHQIEEAMENEQAGADYVMFGHVFPTASKLGLPPRGLQKLQEVTASVKIPVLAIGGIQPHHVTDILASGASGIAVLSGVLLMEEHILAVQQYKKTMERGDRIGDSN